MLGREVEGEAVPVERDLDLGQVHLELAELDPLPAIVERLPLLGPVVVLLVQVLLGGLADDLAGHVAGTLELDQHPLQVHVAERLAVLGLDDDRVPELEPQAA